jgi:hypothetical protein
VGLNVIVMYSIVLGDNASFYRFARFVFFFKTPDVNSYAGEVHSPAGAGTHIKT